MQQTRRKKGFFESSNPYLNEERFASSSASSLTGTIDEDAGQMTVSGAVNKTFLLGAIMLAAAAFSYTFPSPLLIWGGAIGGLIVVIIASRKMERSPVLAPIYAGLEGFFVGGISAMYASMMDGIVMQAVALTFGVFFSMLAIYKSGLIKVTKSFRTGVMMATGGILILYLVSIVMGFFGMNIPFLHEATPLGLVISLGILAIAALNLLLDFDLFEKGEEQGAPEYMEWFAGMGLLITLVWIYVEILRILAIFSGRE
ncbi:MAG: Bax inhibitor-1/YccA family protein [Saprospiraceae bacterium]|nr:Bax inhibitor-1/YccA family protein [Saprospiraceae bacterium]